jgi:hypothetical protein
MTQDMSQPHSVELSIVTRYTDEAVTHTLQLAEAAIEVSIDQDISEQHKIDLITTLKHLLPLLNRLWEEQPEDGSLHLIDLRRAVDG